MSDLAPEAYLYLTVLLAFGYAVYKAVRSPLRPFLIPLVAWREAMAAFRGKRDTVTLVALVIALSTGLQELFTYGPSFDNTVLTLASVGWQALVAIVLAMIAVPFHLYIIGREPTGYLIRDPLAEDRGLRELLMWAALFGGMIWLVAYLIGIAGKLATISVPHEMASLTFASMQLAGFLVSALLALVRPALSSRLRRPLMSGVRLALVHVPTLLVVEIMMLIPPLAFFLVYLRLVRMFVGISVGAHVLNDVLIVMFSIFQFLAVEAATVVFIRAAILQPDPNINMERRNAYVRLSR